MATCSVCKGDVYDAARCCGTCAKLVEAIKQVIAKEENRDNVQQRKKHNVLKPPQTFVPEVFWRQMVGCLCTSMSRVGPGTPLDHLEREEPYPLSLSLCKEQNAKGQNALESYARQKISGAGMRFAKRRAGYLAWNLDWLENKGGWSKVKCQFELLAGIPPRSPNAADCLATAEKDKEVEREAAHVAMEMDGIGPKQSRNLWSCLGLTRYETPLDSRVAKWFNKQQASFIERKKLGSSRYYEGIENRIQSLCKEANEFPCVFDAAAFISEENP